MKLFIISLIALSSTAFAAPKMLSCSVTEYHKEHQQVVLTKKMPLNLDSGSTYVELGTYKNVTFNAVGVNTRNILMYAKVNGVSIMNHAMGAGTMDVYFEDLSNPLSLDCQFE